MMGWELARWIVSLRSVQLMGSFIPGALNGWLLYYINHKEIGLALSMIILQILVGRLHTLGVALIPSFNVSALQSRITRCQRSMLDSGQYLTKIIDNIPFRLRIALVSDHARVQTCPSPRLDLR
jgi:hypothetical protein